MATGESSSGIVAPASSSERAPARTVYTGVYKATGKSIDAQVCRVWKFRNGKATSFQQSLDTALMQEAMGTRDAESTAEASLA